MQFAFEHRLIQQEVSFSYYRPQSRRTIIISTATTYTTTTNSRRLLLRTRTMRRSLTNHRVLAVAPAPSAIPRAAAPTATSWNSREGERRRGHSSLQSSVSHYCTICRHDAHGHQLRDYTLNRIWNSGISRRNSRSSCFFSSTTEGQQYNSDNEEKIKPPIISMKRVYRYLGLETYRKDELEDVFDEITLEGRIREADDDDDDMPITLNHDNLQTYILARVRKMEEESKHRYTTLPPHDKKTAGEEGTEEQQSGEEEDQVLITATLAAEIERQREEFASVEAQRIIDLLAGTDDSTADSTTSLSKHEFVDIITKKATELQWKRTMPITLSMLLVGSSVGIISPAMPFIVSDLQLTHTQFGTVVSAFALSKMIGNVPSAVGVERHGRKPYLTYSLGVIALATAGIGLSGSFEELYICRFVTGFGVAALSTGATMMLTDLSTPLNRATTIAPIMSAFAAGTALGPALGGYLVDSVGLHSTFYVVGVSFSGVAILNRFTMVETKPRKHVQFPWQVKLAKGDVSKQKESAIDAAKIAVGQWGPLMRNSKVRNVMLMNALYWVSLAGSQMTLLPLVLTDQNGLAMSATQVGQAYMGMSLVQIFGNPVFARIADNVGKVPAIIGGCAVISGSMAGLTLCENYTQLAGALGLWAVGSSMLSTAPVAYISDQVSDSERAQALALLRTCGDVGFLAGASSIGVLSDWTGSMETAMQSSAGLLLVATGWFTARNVIGDKITATQK